MKVELANIPKDIQNILELHFGPEWFFHGDALTSLGVRLGMAALNRNLKVKIKKLHEDAIIPKYAKSGDAGLDLTAVDYMREGDLHSYKTGLAVEIPENHVGLLFPRSSLCKTGLILTNHVGVIDSGYRGEITFKFRRAIPEGQLYAVGERVGQMLIIPYLSIELIEVDELSETERGVSGYGSSGK